MYMSGLRRDMRDNYSVDFDFKVQTANYRVEDRSVCRRPQSFRKGTMSHLAGLYVIQMTLPPTIWEAFKRLNER